jgi:glycosyltransferase involved in cell wall biosynthesis
MKSMKGRRQIYLPNPRILFAVNIPYPEGRANTRRISSLARELVQQGCHITILLPYGRESDLTESVIDGVNVEWCYSPIAGVSVINRFGRTKISTQLVSRYHWLIKLWQRSKHQQYDWMYLYQPGIDGLFAALIAKMYNRKICSEYVDLLTSAGYSGLLWKLIYALQVIADRIVPGISDVNFTISTVLKNTYQSRSAQTPTIILPTLVDTSRFAEGNRNRFRNMYKLNSKPVVTFAGSFTRPQGLRIFIQSMAGVVEQHPNTIAIIAGGSLSPDADDATELVEEYRLERNVILLGAIEESEIIDLLAASDILVMPKLDDPVNHAGLSTKLSEYLASGKAVVASTVGDVGKYLTDEFSALLVTPGDRKQLESAISRLVNDPKECEYLGNNGRKVAEREFDISTNVKKLRKALVVSAN